MKNVKAYGNKKFEAKKPDFTSDGVAVWVNKDKNDCDYLTIKIVGHKTITAFKPKVDNEV
jgi:hypothetical protein